MKVQPLCLTLAALLLAAVGAHGRGQTDWWGAVSARVAIHVLSSASGAPVVGAVVSLVSMDDPRPREFAHGVPAPQVTDQSGSAVIQAEFDAAGSTRNDARWDLRGRLIVSCEGYRDASGLLADFTTVIVHGSPVDHEPIEMEIRLVPVEVGGSVTPTVLAPIALSLRRGGYVFQDQVCAPDFFINACPSIVEAIADSRPGDYQLRLSVDDYRGKVGRSRALLWGGVGVILGCEAAGVYFLTREPRSDFDSAAGIACSAAALAGGILAFLGMFGPGPPTQIIDYFNRTYPADSEPAR
jgi:hypothetical protein